MHASTQTLQQPVVTLTEKSAQTDRAPRPRTVQAATQTDPPSRNYQDELKAQIALAELAQQPHNEDIDKLREQAAKLISSDCLSKARPH